MCNAGMRILPQWLLGGLKVVTESKSELGFNNHSSVIALPSTQRAGISRTASLVFIDEWDYHDYPEDDYSNAKPTMAAAEGQLVGVSTPNDVFDPTSFFVTKYKDAKIGRNNFHPIFIGADARPDRTPEWLQKQARDFIGLEYKFEKLYPMTETEALSPISIRSFFDKPVLQRLIDGSMVPLEERENGAIKIFSRWRPGVSYVAGGDSSQGVGGDAQCLTIVGKQGLVSEVAAVIHSNRIAPDIFAYMTCELCKEYKYPLLAPEANSIGQAYISKLVELGYPNLFYSDEKRTKVGVFTSGAKGHSRFNKETMLYDLSVVLSNGELVTRYKTQVEEMYNFQRDDSGHVTVTHGHDDTVMSLAIANQMLKDAHPIINRKHKSMVGSRVKRGMYA